MVECFPSSRQALGLTPRTANRQTDRQITVRIRMEGRREGGGSKEDRKEGGESPKLFKKVN